LISRRSLPGHARTPLAALEDDDLRAFPPTQVIVGTADVLHSDSVDLTQRLRRTGASVALHEAGDGIHGFVAFHALVPEAREAMRRARALIHANSDQDASSSAPHLATGTRQ